MERWNLIGKLVDEVGGEQYIIPENAYRLTEADLEAHLPEHLREGSAPAGVDPTVQLEAKVPVTSVQPCFPVGMTLNEARTILTSKVKPALLAEFAEGEGVRHPHFGEQRIGMSTVDFKEHLKKENKGLADTWSQLEAVAALPN